MRPLRLLESCLYSEDLDAMVDFYSRVLGFELFAWEPGRHAFFRLGEIMLLIFDPRRSGSQSSPPPHAMKGSGHLALEAEEDELDAWRERLETAGVVIERDHAWPQGGRSLYFRDPAGHSVEITVSRIWDFSQGGQP